MAPEQEKLHKFISLDKFSDDVWESRGLNSSGIEISTRLNDFFNQCANRLLTSNKEDYKKCLHHHQKKINSVDYDTEEREYIVHYFFILSEICSIDFKEALVTWMYGEGVFDQAKPQKRLLVEIIANSCTNCDGALDTEIVERQKGIPDFAYTIVKCKDCEELNMIDLGPEIKQYSFGNYTVEAQLPKTEYSWEQALEELNQMKSKNKNASSR